MANSDPSSASTIKTLGELEQVVLFALLHLQNERPDACYSKGIRDEIESRTGRRVAPGALYTVLDRLEVHGLVASRFGEATPQRGGRRKKLIRLEPSGVQALAQAADRFQRMSNGLLNTLRTLDSRLETSESGGEAR